MKKNILFTVIIIVACALMLLYANYNRKPGNVAVLNIVNSNNMTIDLSEDNIHEFTTQTGALLDFTIEVEGMKARFINSNCPDGLCEAYGWQSHTFDEAICAPAGVVLSIEQEQ